MILARFRGQATPVTVAAAVLAAVAASTGLAVVNGGVFLTLALVGTASLCAIPLSRHLGPRFLVTWLAFSGLAFPFLRFANITSDRVWLTIALVGLLATQSPQRMRSNFRSISLIGGWFIVAYSAAALSGSGVPLASRLASLEAVLLPAATFILAYRLVVATSNRVEACQRIAGSMALGGGLLGLLGIAERIFGFQLSSLSGGVARVDSELGGVTRIAGPYAVPEVYGLVLAICLGATLYWALSDRTHRVKGLLAAAPQLAAMGLILFRAFWLDGILILLIVVAFRPRHVGRALVSIAFSGLFGLIALSHLGTTGVVAQRLNNIDNISGRVDVWHIAVDMARSHPIHGVGLDNFVRAEESLPQAADPRVQGTLSPHSSYLAVLAEQGLIGFLPFLVLTLAVAALVVVTWKRATTVEEGLFAATLTAVALAYVLTSLTLTMIGYGQSNAFLAALLGVAVGRLGHDGTGTSLATARQLPVFRSTSRAAATTGPP